MESKATRAEDSSFKMNCYQKTTKTATYLAFIVTLFLITLLFRLLCSLFVVLEHALEFLKKTKLMEAGEEATELHYGATHPERRKYPRFNVDLPIQYNKIDSSTSRNGRVMNLSEGGMLIQSHERMEIGRHLKSEFSFIRGCEFGTIKTLAEVVWQDIFMTEAWGDYRHGLKFLEVSGKDKVKLDDFLVSLS